MTSSGCSGKDVKCEPATDDRRKTDHMEAWSAIHHP